MRRILHFVNSQLQQMPRGLSVLTRVFLVFAIIIPVIILLTVAAQGRYSYFVLNGRQVSYQEFWRDGGLLTFLIIAIYSAILVYGFLHASRWSRPLLLLPFIALPIWGMFRHATFSLYGALSSVFTIAILVWYLFFRRTVRDYYRRADEPAA
jgi:hypothetical protein